MPWMKKRTVRTRPRRYGRYGARRYVRPTRSLTQKYSGCKYFEESVNAGTIELGGGLTAMGGKWNISLASLPNYNVYRSLFDFAAIKSFRIQLVPRGTFTSSAAGTIYMPPRIYFAEIKDYDEPVPVNPAQVMQYTNAKIRQLSGTRSININVRKPVPALQQANASGGTMTTVAGPNKSFQWLSLSGAGGTVPYLGVSWWAEVDPIMPSELPICDIYYHVKLVCKEKA